ncbi:DUF7738 domain-containing protein [Janthinobacterium sp. HH01]|uniref:DUF7738 domain-containing protein n=1 Tax=Janthinobacterium sp. HH01 TaxID=1198452 RepID=UPI0012681EBE|nr:hypothetical protein [Janthinobacterium sp. HH01]
MNPYLVRLIISSTLFAIGGASARPVQDTAAPSAKSTFIEKWNNAVKKAAEATGTDVKERDFGEPRKIPPGGKPEIILRKDKIVYNGQVLELGKTAAQWDAILPGERRCDRPVNPVACAWDELGIMIVFSDKFPKKIKDVTIYLRLPIVEEDDGVVRMSVTGVPLPPLNPFYPKSTFSGYLELDGYGIDRNSMFWEVLKKTDNKRNIHCGLRDCIVPGGNFGRESLIYFDLDKPVMTGMVNNINITDLTLN